MAGDLLSSLLKRRLYLRQQPRNRAVRSRGPISAVATRLLGLSVFDIAAGVVIFLLGEILISRVLFRLRLRDRPY
jgi:CDP-2,3-bis-(O-geranylgeranyl)-sn-glycerol synthase